MEIEYVERAVLGAMLLDPIAVVDAMAALHWSDWCLQSHQEVFRGMGALYERGANIDLISIRSQLGPDCVTKLGGADWFLSLTEGVPRRMDVGQSCKTIASRSLARRGILKCSEAQSRLFDPTESPEAILDELVRDLTHDRPEDSMSVSDVIPLAMKSLDGDEGEVISTGIREIDEATAGGMRPKELWVIGAQPSGGKSSLARQIERSVLRNGIGVHSHSIEVPKEDWVRFHIAREAGVPAWKLRQPWLMSAMEKERMRAASIKVDQWPLVIDDSGSVHIRTLLGKSRLTAIRRGVKVYTVDYLQMLKGDERDIRHRIGEACRGLKQFAKDNNVVVLLLSQMARRGDVNSRPSLQDLKESGDIEAAADVAILNYRPKKDDKYTGEDELIVAKQRNGPIGPINMTYVSDTLTFQSR